MVGVVHEFGVLNLDLSLGAKVDRVRWGLGVP